MTLLQIKITRLVYKVPNRLVASNDSWLDFKWITRLVFSDSTHWNYFVQWLDSTNNLDQMTRLEAKMTRLVTSLVPNLNGLYDCFFLFPHCLFVFVYFSKFFEFDWVNLIEFILPTNLSSILSLTNSWQTTFIQHFIATLFT